MKLLKIWFVVALSFSTAAASLSAQNDDKDYEKFKQYMKRYASEDTAEQEINRRYGDAIATIEYTVFLTKQSFAGFSVEEFGQSKIEPVKKIILGTIVSKDGLVVLDGSVFKTVQNTDTDLRDGCAVLTFKGQSYSIPQDFIVNLRNPSQSFGATFVGIDHKSNLAFIKILNPSDSHIPYIDMENRSLSDSEFSETSLYRAMLYADLVDKKQMERMIDYTGKLKIDKNDFHVGIDRAYLNKFAEDVDLKELMVVNKPLQPGIPVIDPKTLRIAGFTSVVEENKEVKRSVVEEGLKDQGNNAFEAVAMFSTNFPTMTSTVLRASEVARIIKNPDLLQSPDNKSWAGITEFEPVEKSLADLAGLQSNGKGFGAVAVEVVEESPAYKCGMRSGDIITSWNGEPVSAVSKNEAVRLQRQIESASAGTEVPLTYVSLSKGNTTPVSAKLVIEKAPKSSSRAEKIENKIYGAIFKEITSDLISMSAYMQRRHLGKVMVDSVISGSMLEAGGLRQGDILVTINGTEITGIDDLSKVLTADAEEKAENLVLIVERDGQTTILKARADKKNQ